MALPAAPAYPPAASTPPGPQDAPDTSSGAEDAAPDTQDETADESSEPLKNHLYLPKDFPMTKKPVAGGPPEKFLVMAEFVDDEANGEHCFKITTVDGVPIESESGDDESEQEGGADEEGSDEADSGAPPSSPPSTPGDVTKMIMGGGSPQ